MKTASVSDPHWFDDRDLEVAQTFCDIMRHQRPDHLHWNGDIWDFWQAQARSIMQTKTWDCIAKLNKERARQGLDTTYCPNNHDHGAKKEYMPYAEFTTRLEIDNVVYLHGWEFDTIWNGIGWLPGMHELAFAISSHAPKLMVPIYHLLFKTPGEKQASAVSDWTLAIESIHSRARMKAQKDTYVDSSGVKRNKAYIIGHTHNVVPFDGLICNAGSLTQDRRITWAEDGKVSLKCF